MINRKTLISLGTGISQIPLMKKARENGSVIIGIDQNNKAPGVDLADEFIHTSTYDTQSVLENLISLNEIYTFDGILHRVSGPALYTAAAITEHFHLQGLDKEIVQLSTEKAALRTFCKKNGILFPLGEKINRTGDFDSLFKPPLIIKPDLPIVGKKDVFVVSDRSRLSSYQKQACRSSYNGFAEIEEYIDGIDVSCMFLLNKGDAQIITFWDELVGIEEEGNIKGIGVSVPSVISGTVVQDNIENIVNKFCSFFPLVYALLILSFRVDFQKQAFIVELHADYTGDLILDELLPAARNSFDFFSIPLSIAVGEYSASEFINDYKPTAVIDQKKSYDVIQKKNIETLLKHVGLYCRNLRNIPKHLEWYRRCGVNNCQ